jgi:hypothetical protein
VLGAWCLVFGAWCLVLGVWCLVLGAWCLVLGAWWFGVRGRSGCVVWGAWCGVRGVGCVVRGAWCGFGVLSPGGTACCSQGWESLVGMPIPERIRVPEGRHAFDAKLWLDVNPWASSPERVVCGLWWR